MKLLLLTPPMPGGIDDASYPLVIPDSRGCQSSARAALAPALARGGPVGARQRRSAAATGSSSSERLAPAGLLRGALLCPRRPWARFARGPGRRVAAGPALGTEHAHCHQPEGGHELERRPADRQE